MAAFTNYGVLKAYYGYTPRKTYDNSFFKNVYFDITNLFKQKFDSSQSLIINPQQDYFGSDLESIIEISFRQYNIQQAFDIYVGDKDNETKLIIKLLNEDTNETYNFYFIRDLGWAVKNDQGEIVVQSSESEKALEIGKNVSFKSAGTGRMFGKAAQKAAEKFVGLDPEDAAILAQITQGGIEGVRGGVEGLGSVLKSVIEARMEFDNGKETHQLQAAVQRCIIRYAGGNLLAERGNLREPFYKLDSSAPGYQEWAKNIGRFGPILGTKKDKNLADNGKFNKELLEAVTYLLPKLNEDLKGTGVKITDPQVIPLSILQTKVCRDFIGTIAQGNEQDNYNHMVKNEDIVVSKVAAVANDSNIDVEEIGSGQFEFLKSIFGIDYDQIMYFLRKHFGKDASVPTSLPPPAQTPAGGAARAIQLSPDEIFNSSEFRELENFAKNAREIMVSNKIREAFDKNKKELSATINDYNNSKLNKNDVNNLIDQKIASIEREQAPPFSKEGPKFKELALNFLNFIKNKIVPTLQENKNKKTKRIINDYKFVSNKNKKIHSILMEQLKKDLKRG